MKIVCDNCATKYSIADEKVRGKVFKIRCKKCSHIIVVRGGDGAGVPMDAADGAGSGANGSNGYSGGDDEQQTIAAGGHAAPAALGAMSGASDAVWHLVVDREQIGPLTPAEVRAKFAAGDCDVETYAWREGFADWLRLGSIDDFRDLGAGASAPAESEGATRRTDGADLFSSNASGDDSGSSDAAGDLFGSAGASAASAPAPSASFSGGGAGLFGAPDEAHAPAPQRQARTSSPGFGGGGAAMGGAAEASGDPGPMKGQRNENSVLFSLNNLQALASGGNSAGPSSSSAKPGVDQRPGFANSQTEGSGLIDIRAMAASTLASGPTSSPAKGGDEPSFSAAPIFSPMAAPILMPNAPSGPPKWMWAILGVGVLAVVLIVVVGVLLLTRKPELPVVAVNVPPPVAAVPVPAVAPTPGAPAAVAPAAVPGQPSPAAATDEDKKAKKPVKVASASSPKGERKQKNEAVGGIVPPPEDKPAASPKKSGGGKKDELDDLLNTASPDKAPKAAAAPKREESGDDSLPDQLGKSEIVGGMAKVKGRVAGCYDQFKVPGLANVSVTIGKSGSVSSATVSGAFSGTPTGSCVEKAVKSASFPKFKGSPQTINYPFMLR